MFCLFKKKKKKTIEVNESYASPEILFMERFRMISQDVISL